MPADYGENAPDSLNKGLVAARFDGVVPEEADAVLTVCKEVDAPPCHSRGGPVSAANPLKSLVNCANLPSIVRGTKSTDPVRVRADCIFTDCSASSSTDLVGWGVHVVRSDDSLVEYWAPSPRSLITQTVLGLLAPPRTWESSERSTTPWSGYAYILVKLLKPDPSAILFRTTTIVLSLFSRSTKPRANKKIMRVSHNNYFGSGRDMNIAL